MTRSERIPFSFEVYPPRREDLVASVLDGGAPGIHLYAFNQHAPVLDVLRGLGAI